MPSPTFRGSKRHICDANTVSRSSTPKYPIFSGRSHLRRHGKRSRSPGDGASLPCNDVGVHRQHNYERSPSSLEVVESMLFSFESNIVSYCSKFHLRNVFAGTGWMFPRVKSQKPQMVASRNRFALRMILDRVSFDTVSSLHPVRLPSKAWSKDVNSARTGTTLFTTSKVSTGSSLTEQTHSQDFGSSINASLPSSPSSGGLQLSACENDISPSSKGKALASSDLLKIDTNDILDTLSSNVCVISSILHGADESLGTISGEWAGFVQVTEGLRAPINGTAWPRGSNCKDRFIGVPVTIAWSKKLWLGWRTCK